MKSAKQVIGSFILKQGLNYLKKDPARNFPKLVRLIKKIDRKGLHQNIYQKVEEIFASEENNCHVFIKKLFDDIHPDLIEKFGNNFVLNSSIFGYQAAKKYGEKYDCNIPWAILIDPTSKCNLKCTGCWAAEYDKNAALSFDVLDRIINEGKQLGIYFYLFSGGEPLTRKKDLLKLAGKHNDCMFLAFTNGTLIDDAFAKELQKAGNFTLAISIEGFEKETDLRRGKGTYAKVMTGMEILKKHGILFGFSTCYHRMNTDVVGSEEYLNWMIAKGCKYGWYFTYMPLGKDAPTDLLVSPDQREFMYYQVRKFRDSKPIFLLDFWNDGEYSQGCIAGGRVYLHINANGDVEPCAFIHYSNVNIKNVSLLEALKSPLFMQYQSNQPFNENHLRPCPLLDNPDKLKEMVHKANAKSTQFLDEESVDDLANKCQDISKKWAKTADGLWKEFYGPKKPEELRKII